MRIGVWHDLPSGGGRRAFENHCAGLVALGHELVVVCPRRDEPGPLLPPSVVVIPVSLPELNIGAPGADLSPPIGVINKLAALDWHLARAAKVLNRANVEVAFVNSGRGTRCVDLARRLTMPSVLYLQEPYRWLYEALPALPWVQRGRRGRAILAREAWAYQIRREVAAAHGYHLVLVNSRFSRESVLRAYGIESTVCSLGVDTDHFAPGTGDRKNSVVSLGAMTSEKRHLECVMAVAAVPSDIRPRLVCISNTGSRTYETSVVDAAAAAKVTLTVLTQVPDADVLKHLQEALALVYAPRLEPFGLAPLEAAAAETPTVAVAEAGVRETVRHEVTGLLVDDATQLGGALAKLIGAPSWARELGRNGRVMVLRDYTLAASNARLVGHLEATAARARR